MASHTDPFTAVPGDTIIATGDTVWTVLDTCKVRDGATRIQAKRPGPLGPVTQYLYFYPTTTR